MTVDATLVPKQAICTQVLVKLTLREDVDVRHAMQQMRAEMAATAHLYLAGKIAQWFSQVDGRGVMFIFNSTSVDETRGLMADLPFVHDGLAELEFTRLGPLMPLGSLLP